MNACFFRVNASSFRMNASFFRMNFGISSKIIRKYDARRPADLAGWGHLQGGDACRAGISGRSEESL
jgi:hypothetical protein